MSLRYPVSPAHVKVQRIVLLGAYDMRRYFQAGSLTRKSNDWEKSREAFCPKLTYVRNNGMSIFSAANLRYALVRHTTGPKIARGILIF
jgi:hypothetical protein